jgi:hypothetical protein
MAPKPRTVVDKQLTDNRELRLIHARSQMRLDQMRMTAVARSTTANALVQAGGIARNVLAGTLPLETSPKVRRHVAQHIGTFTMLKALRADAKARVLRERPT